MRGFYPILGVLLWAGPGAAQDVCRDLSLQQRGHPDLPEIGNEVHLRADQVDLRAAGISRLTGQVEMQRERDLLHAEVVQYDSNSNELEVQSRTFFETDALQISARSAKITLAEELAEFRGAEYVAFAAGARGSADALRITGAGQADLEGVRYTTCPEGDEAWVLQGDEINLDQAGGIGRARNVRLTFQGVPLFWLPLFYFPVGEQRQTGFLPPRLGDSDQTGADASVPFYVNLAPNYDLTLTPRYMAERGAQMQLELRYLWSHSQGASAIEYLDRDERTDQTRKLLSSRLRGGLPSGWTWQGVYQEVSDIDYLTDLGSDRADAAQAQLPQYLQIDYRQRDIGLHGHLSLRDYQNLSRDLAVDERAYARLPEMRLNWQRPYRNAELRPGFRAQAVQFLRGDRTEAWRGDTALSLDWRRDTPASFLAAHGQYRYTGYALSEPDGSERRLSRSLPLFQLNGGLRFVRNDGGGAVQTLTPQVAYLYVPFREQSDIPVFDTSLPDFTLDQLLARNRFSGPDRIADANLVTTAAQMDWFEDDGLIRRFSARIGVQWRLRDSRVSLPGDSGIEAGGSDWLGALDWRVNRRLRARMAGEWNAENNDLDQAAVAARFQPDTRRLAQVAYRFRRDNFEQADALVAWPLSQRWRVAGRWTYAIDAERTLEGLGGLEYRSCCWAAQVAWRRHLNGTAEQFDSSVYVQLQLHGLGRIGEGLDQLLERDILAP